MKKYLVIGLAALGLAAFAPQPAKAGVSFGFSFGPAYYYPDYYPGYYYHGYPYYYGRVTTGIIIPGGTIAIIVMMMIRRAEISGCQIAKRKQT